jgi:hypothetical protein
VRKTLLYVLAVALLIVICHRAHAGSQQTSGTNSTALISKVRYNLNEASASFWSDTELLSYMNNGIQDIATRTRATQTTENATTADGVIEYTISTNYIGMYGIVYWTNSTKPKALSKRNPFSETSGIGKGSVVNEPAYWAESRGKVIVWPPCNGANSGKQMVIYLNERPSAISSGDAIPLPAYLDNSLEWYVTSQALYKDQRYAQAGYFKAMYQTELDRFRADLVDFGQEPKDQ